MNQISTVMKKFLLTGFFAALLVACFAQKPYKVVFYNFENLFDTLDDPDKYDEEFTPRGVKKWNTAKYNKRSPTSIGCFLTLLPRTGIFLW